MSWRTAIAAVLAALSACALAVGFSAASFTDSTQNPQTVSAVADFLSPSVEASAIAKTQGGVAGYVKAGGTYYVYAKVADPGSVSSISSVKADVSTLTSGQTAVALSAGSYTAGGVSYNYRSAQLTVSAGVSAGSKTYSVATADAAGNSGSQSFSASVDNGPFAGADFDTANGGGNSGKPEQGDTVTFTYNKAPEPGSILSGWTGATTASVTVTITQSSSADTLSVGSTALGSVALKGNYVSKTVTFASSPMVLSGNAVTITLGSPSSSSALEDDNGNREPVWTPSASAYDRAANACSTVAVTAANGRQF